MSAASSACRTPQLWAFDQNRTKEQRTQKEKLKGRTSWRNQPLKLKDVSAIMHKNTTFSGGKNRAAWPGPFASLICNWWGSTLLSSDWLEQFSVVQGAASFKTVCFQEVLWMLGDPQGQEFFTVWLTGKFWKIPHFHWVWRTIKPNH